MKKIHKLKFVLLNFFLLLALVTVYYANFLYWRADWLAANGHWSVAASVPSFCQDFFRRDYVLSLKKNPASDEVESAMSALEKSLDGRPHDYFMRLAYADAAIVFGSVGQEDFFDKAEMRLQEALKISPHHQQAYYILAKLKVARVDKNGLVETMDQAVALDLESGEAHFFYGLFSLQLGDTNKGFHELALAKKFQHGPQSNQEARLVAGYYGDAGFYKEAINYYKLALTYNSQDWESLLKKGLVYYYDGDRDGARNVFTELLNKNLQFRETADFQKLTPILKQLGL